LHLDELAHDLVGQLAVGLLALLLGDLALLDAEFGEIPADLCQFVVFLAADGAAFFRKLLVTMMVFSM
jgi:hypothetical protein